MTAELQGPPILENKLIGPPPLDGPAFSLEPVAKRVRTFVAGVAIADSCRVMMMHETSRLAVYYFPIEDVRADLLVPTTTIVASPSKGDATYYSIEVEGRSVNDAAWRYLHPAPGCPEVAGYVAFHWREMDAWFEEDDEVFVHARDPYHRIDVLPSSRHVRVVIGGQTVAETRRAMFLFETSLPPRYYIPKEEVRMDLLQQSTLKTACAYKGPTSAYWQAATADGAVREVAWSYKTPPPEVARVAGRVAFFNERVDAIYVDGVELSPPETPWS